MFHSEFIGRHRTLYAALSMLPTRLRPLLLLVTAACVTAPRSPSAGSLHDSRSEFGVLVMAHGASPEWNAGVLQAVALVGERYPTEVAFGMADAGTIQEGVRRLEERGVGRIGVVRLFISGESWYDRTEQILGLVPGAPDAPPSSGSTTEFGDRERGGHGAHDQERTFWMIRTRASFALNRAGLAEAGGMGAVLADRARALSRDPQREVVLILAHGPGDDDENARWLQTIDKRANAVRHALPFRRVVVETLREDWPAKRRESEQRIRALVEGARNDGVATIVIPFRVQGFGPYADVLAGLDYVADGQGLLPHAAVSEWIVEQAELLRKAVPRAVVGAGPLPNAARESGTAAKR